MDIKIHQLPKKKFSTSWHCLENSRNMFLLNNLAPQDKVFTALNYSLKINTYSHKLSYTHTETHISYPSTSELSLPNDIH